jgi:hypothetical protein
MTTIKYACYDIFETCCKDINNGELISLESSHDKEFHFQNWFKKRLINANILHDANNRISYPDFILVNYPEGYELKGLAFPGRDKTYDSNSQVPTGLHNGRQIF